MSPPPPPPPPPPLVSIGLSPVNLPSNRVNSRTNDAQQSMSSGLASSRHQLTDQRALPGDNQFKEELEQKHLEFLNSKTDTLSIEDKLKYSKELANKSNISSRINSCLDTPKDSIYYQSDKLHEKLMSTMQREKRPFAYSPDVNDPNNRGKLDLNQIKSPEMRRRLMINMESGSSADDEDDNPSKATHQEPVDLERSSCEKKNFSLNSTSTSDTLQNLHKYPDYCQKLPQMQQTIFYNEPPVFYNNENYTLEQKPIQTCGSLRSNFDDLGLELTRSLDSLSQLVTDLHTHEPRSRSQQVTRTETHTQIEFHPPPQRMSTFLPNETSKGLAEQRQRSDYSNMRNLLPGTSDNRLIGDCLLSPGADYFSLSNSPSPYSISPYYGSALDTYEDDYERTLRQPKQFSTKTFSTTNHSGICSNEVNGYRFDDPVDRKLEQMTRTLREEAKRIETEINRLNEIRKRRG